MDSALCLPFGPLTTVPLHFHSNKNTTTRIQLTKPHFTFNPSPLSLFPNGSGFHRQQRQTFSNVVFAIDRLSKPATKENKGGNHEIVRGTVGASLILACAVAMMGCSSKLSPKAFADSIPTPPGMEESLTTPKGALKSFLDTTVNLASPNVKSIRGSKMFDKVTKPSQKEAADLKMEAVKLMKAGKGKDAEAKLWDLYKRVKGYPESAHFVGMALVEIRIAQGNYPEAYKFLEDNLKDYEISDARFYLYKAILCIMDNKFEESDKYEESVKYWKKFTGRDQDDQSGGLNPKKKNDRSGGFPFSFPKKE